MDTLVVFEQLPSCLQRVCFFVVYSESNLDEEGGLLMRVKVRIRCKQCGERFVLRGKKERGKIETGFKQCICDNRDRFEIEEDVI